MGLSIRAYARHRGVSHVAVKKAIDTGRITPEADGTIEPNRADLEWAQNTLRRASLPLQKHLRRQRSQLARQVLRLNLSHHHSLLAGPRLLQARTVNEVVKAQTNKVRLAQLKGDLVDRSQAIAHVFRLARTERDAWLNWPARISAEMAAKLEVDAHGLHVALESAVRDHLIELGEMRPRVD
jgi:hypothetical protein